MPLSLCQMRSVLAWCDVSMVEVSQALSQALFRGHCCWKNFSLWRKQTAHWLCSLLSGCINGPLTSHSLTIFLSLKHIVIAATVQIQQIGHPSTGSITTNSVTRIHVKPPSLFLFFTRWQEQRRSMLRDPVSQDQWHCLFSETLMKITQGMEIPFSPNPCVKPPLGMCFSQ